MRGVGELARSCAIGAIAVGVRARGRFDGRGFHGFTESGAAAGGGVRGPLFASWRAGAESLLLLWAMTASRFFSRVARTSPEAFEACSTAPRGRSRARTHTRRSPLRAVCAAPGTSRGGCGMSALGTPDWGCGVGDGGRVVASGR